MNQAQHVLALLREARDKTIVLSFGRFNPPHRGHKLLTDLLVSTAQRLGADHALYLKGRTGPKDPLSIEDRRHFLSLLTPGLRVLFDPRLPDPPDIFQSYSDAGYTSLVLVLGGDRQEKLTNDINTEVKAGRLHFTSIKLLSAGDRSGTDMWSATQQRDAAAANDYPAFRAGLPPNYPEREALSMFAKVRHGMGL